MGEQNSFLSSGAKGDALCFGCRRSNNWLILWYSSHSSECNTGKLAITRFAIHFAACPIWVAIASQPHISRFSLWKCSATFPCYLDVSQNAFYKSSHRLTIALFISCDSRPEANEISGHVHRIRHIRLQIAWLHDVESILSSLRSFSLIWHRLG